MNVCRAWMRLSLCLFLLGACTSGTQEVDDGDVRETSAAAGSGGSGSDGDAMSGGPASKDGNVGSAGTDSPAASETPGGDAPVTAMRAAPTPSTGAADPASSASTGPSTPPPSAGMPVSDSDDSAEGGFAMAPAEEPTAPVGGGNGEVQSGTLTAGAWDDNINFNRFEEYRREHADLAGALDTSDEEHTTAWQLWSGERAARTTLDIVLVIDTTGSMGDEIRYLQTEFDALVADIGQRYPDADQRWALVVYRDQGDADRVRAGDCTGSASDYAAELSGISAGGGGDYPEAPDAALAKMLELDFRTDDATARLAFWVGDAPHHTQNAEPLLAAVRGAADADVHIYPVASSGVDDLTELTMRAAAQLTGGRYLFLTDDSGVGGAHKEPSIPCYFVTRLDQAIVRMVDIELSGSYVEPEEEQIIRTGGSPEDGACTLESGDEVVIF